VFSHICKLDVLYFLIEILLPQFYQVQSLQVSLASTSKIPIKSKGGDRSDTRRGVSLAWQSIFVVEGISGSTANEGLQLMGFDVDESSGYEVVNRD